MKRKAVLFVFFIGAISYQCNIINYKAEQNVVIEGKIEKISLDNLYLLNHFGDTVSTIDIAPNNNFGIEINGIEEGYFTLLFGEEKSNLYLYPGDNLHFKINTDTLLISGKGEERNIYLNRKLSPEFDWYSSYYKTKQKGNMMIYFRDHYIKKLKQELQGINDGSQFAQHELLELEYEFADLLLTNQISLETDPELDETLAKDLNWAKSINIDDSYRLNNSKNYISLVTRTLLSKNDFNGLYLDTYYGKINHPKLKTYFLSNLISPLYKQLQYGEGDFRKAETVESFITNKQPKDSIGYHIFNLYKKFHQAEGKLASFSYEDINGEMVSLEEYRGKYVLIDFWATWCVNCIKEFPYLKEIEKRFKNEKIEFIGISIDKQEAKEKWKKMVDKKGLTNVQLFAPAQGYPEKDDITDPFMNLVYLNSYYLGIPHYTLLDPEGKIVDAFFYRPSNKKCEKYIAELLNN